MSEYKRGSEWRKWDLHIHSNASDGNGTPVEIVDEAIRKGISVIALTDHHTVKNIDEIKEYSKDKPIQVISGIEFRTEYGEKSVHIIGLFPDVFNGIELNSKALNDLILSPLDLSETKIIAKGRESDPSLTEDKAFKKGMFQVQVDFKRASSLIRKYGGLVTVHSGDKHGSIEEMKHQGKSPRNVSDIADSLGPVKEEILKEYVDLCEMSSLDEKNAKFYLKTFNRCTIVASDAHDFKKIGEGYSWIKADPNTNGLQHASIEPDRIFIGEIPPALDRLQKNKTKTLERLTVSWEDSYTGLNGEWFKDVDIIINPEMTAVIGNKGSGKTAVAEIIALLSDCKNYDDFVFLNKTKFKNKRLATNFKAKLNWYNNVLEKTKNLDEEPDFTAEELIHFVPQRSFESFCNDSDEKFEEEINKVVFSRMPTEEKLGFSTFKSLLENKKNVIVEKIDELSLKIKSLNESIKRLEGSRDNKNVQALKSAISQNDLELEEHNKIKPIEVKPPEDLDTKEYQELICEHKKVQEQISIEQELLNDLFQKQSDLEIIIESITNLSERTKASIGEISKKLQPYEIDIEKVFNFNVNSSDVTAILSTVKEEIKAVKIKISDEPSSLGTLIISENQIKKKIDIFNQENEGKLSKYQKFLDDNKQWNEKLEKINKRKEELNSQIEYLGDLVDSPIVTDINKLKIERLEKVKQIFNCYNDEVKIFNQFKVPITNFIQTYKEQLDSYDVKIDVGLYPKDDFVNSFVETYIDSGVISDFRGQDGQKLFKTIVNESDFTTYQGIELFINRIQSVFEKDSKKCYHNIFKKGKYDVFVDTFYNLGFLKARYSLQLYGKPLQELSPGERGSLLLVFYLLLDARDIPLVLDQPEDNLDNESVAKILVPFIREAKKRRQIIIITHNSNLAVVSDAEQVIRVKLDKASDKFSFDSGSLESNIINDVVDVLEGTKNSFKIRQTKYDIT